MAFSQPQVYLDELAKPILERFKAEPDSYDLAVATCIILYHFSDVVGRVRRIKGPVAADQIAEKVPEFATVRALANAGKHVELERHPNTALVGLRAEHMKKGSGAAFNDGADGSTKADATRQIVVDTPDGETHDVLHTCNSTFAALIAEQEFLQS